MLLVDDERQFLSVMERYFKMFGWAVDCTREREEAEALMLSYSYHVVLTDLFLTPTRESDGLTLIRFAKYKFPRTIVILLTAHCDEEVRKAAHESGADAVLTKPKPLSEIAVVVDDLWRNRHD